MYKGLATGLIETELDDFLRLSCVYAKNYADTQAECCPRGFLGRASYVSTRWRRLLTKGRRRRAGDFAKKFCKSRLVEFGSLPSETELRAALRDRFGTGFLSALWLAVMLSSLLVNLKKLLQDRR